MNDSFSRVARWEETGAATQQQLAKIPIPGGWTWQTIEIESQSWRVLLPADGNAFLADDEVAGRWPDPYWTQIWPAAKSLAKIVLQSDWAANTSVLELGCGSGLVGLAALARGCRVTFSDYVPLAVDLAVANARSNGHPQACGEILDWRNPPTEPKHDILLAADVLYDPELHAPLLGALRARLAHGGVVWLGDPGRLERVEKFLWRAEEAGWRVELRDEHNRPVAALARGEFRLILLRR
jgi:predicted nicotinamide N-methyase